MSVTKTTCDRYDVRENGEWAIICVDERGGMLQIHSSFGQWSYCWPDHGCTTFRHFLIQIGARQERDYVLKKLAGGLRDFNEPETIRRFKRFIIKARRGGLRIDMPNGWSVFGKEEARIAWDELDDVSGEGYMSADVMGHAIQDTRILSRLVWDDVDGASGCFAKDYPNGLRRFFDKVWPAFMDTIAKEIACPSQPTPQPT